MYSGLIQITNAIVGIRSVLALAALALAGGWGAGAQTVQHLGVTVPGGMPGTPMITSVQRATNGVIVTWDGPAGYYQLLESPSLNGPWQPLLPATNLNRTATVPLRYSNAVFKVFGPGPQYAGSQACLECHSPILKTETHTLHAGAFTNADFVAEGGQTNGYCLTCHTVGSGLPTGFISKAKTPRLEGVQCENCHGPAGNHAANPDDFSARPRVEVAAAVCGGCHSGSHQPTYEEWNSSLHAPVVEDMSATNRIDSCGRCHSGTARLSLMHGQIPPANDANIGIVCVVCHDPHSTNANPAQLRNPVASTNDFFLPTTGVFTNKYDPTVNICAQCHNHRGASWTTSSRPPHNSPQYNFLLGTVGELASGPAQYQPSSHALMITNQCVGCHMQTKAFQSAISPAVTGHSFKVESFDVCRECHTAPEDLAAFATGAISNRVQQLKAALDLWATTKAPAALQAKYGALAWEYTAPGELSAGASGPGATEQTQIPVSIQKARFNVYLVLHDGSFGVHNGAHSVALLDAAESWIAQELRK